MKVVLPVRVCVYVFNKGVACGVVVSVCLLLLKVCTCWCPQQYDAFETNANDTNACHPNLLSQHSHNIQTTPETPADTPTPVEYCPSSSTEGFASKSLSCSRGVKKEPNLNWSSSGRT